MIYQPPGNGAAKPGSWHLQDWPHWGQSWHTGLSHDITPLHVMIYRAWPGMPHDLLWKIHNEKNTEYTRP